MNRTACSRTMMIQPSPISRTILLLLLLLAVAPMAAAQDTTQTIAVEIGAGYEVGTMKIKFDPADYSSFSRGTSSAPSVYGAIQLPGLLTFLGCQIGPRLGVQWRRYDAVFTKALPDLIVFRAGQPVIESVQRRLDFSMESVDLEFMWHVSIKGIRFEIDGGSILGIQRLSNVLNTQRLLSPSNARFENSEGLETLDDGRVLVYDRGSQLRPWSASVSGFEAISYPITLSKGMSIIPDFYIRWSALSPFQNASSYDDFNVGVGLSLRYEFPAWKKDPPPVTPVAPSLTADVDLYSIGDDGERLPYALLRSGAVHHRTEIATAPEILFDRGSAMIPKRYHLRASTAPRDVQIDSLLHLDPAAIRASLPDLIGARFRDDSAGTIRLISLSPNGEIVGFGRKRAEVLRDYLTGTWGWDANRIAIAEERQIAEGEPAVLVELPAGRSLAAEWDVPQSGITPIRVSPEIAAAAGARWWDLTFTQNGRLLAHPSSDDAADSSVDLDMLLRDVGAAGNPTPLIVKLTVEDSAGEFATARKELPFVRDTASRSITTLLYLASAATADPVGDWSRSLEGLAAGEHDAMISVTGFGSAGMENARRVGELLRRSGAAVRDITASADVEGPGGVSIAIERRGSSGR